MFKSQKILEEIEQSAKTKFLPIVGKERGSVLVDVIKRYKPKRILEIGTFVGYSAILMGQYLLDDGQIITIEKDLVVAQKARDNIERAGLSKKIMVIVGLAEEIIPLLKGQFDMIFIDAEKRRYLEYMKLVEPKFSVKTVVVADNVKKFSSKVSDFLHYVHDSKEYVSQTFVFGNDATELLKKNK